MVVVLSFIFCVLIILIGGEQGVRSIITLIGNGITLLISIYLISSGADVRLVVFVCSIVFTTLTLLIQNKYNQKTMAAILAVIGVMLILTIFCAFIVYQAGIGGYSELDIYEDECSFLNSEININAEKVMIAVVIIGLLGAIMDTALSITSAVYEVYQNNKKLTFHQLIRSGESIGRDILGTTINTLFFAAIGESLFLIILFMKYQYSFLTLINSKAFLQVLAAIIISNLGCLLIIPLSSIIVSYVITKGMFRSKKKSNDTTNA